MSDSKKKGLECPVCKGVFSADDLPVHASLHFDDESIRKCDYPGCSACIDENQFSDHMLAHQMYDSNGNDGDGDKLNDSTLARIIEKEQDMPGPSVNNSDEALARRIQLEDNRKLEEESFQNLQETYGMTDNKDGYVKQFEKEMDRKVGGHVSVGDYYAMKSNMHNSLISGSDSGNTRTTGVIKHLRSSSNNFGHGLKKYFSVETDHFAGDVGDKGWGCGYRNIQMLLSALLHDACYRKNLSCLSDEIPSVPKLQSFIEKSWKDGYDTSGCEQLGGSLQGTRKWIGATEVAALLSWLKIKARLIDFHKPTGEGGQHPQLFNWIHNYFESRHGDENTPPPFPIYIQHQGHSRLCVGCEVSNQSDSPIKLLMFDPGFSKAKMQSLLKSKDLNNHTKCIKKSIKQMRHDQFQLLYIDGLYRKDDEIKASKSIRSTRIPP